MDWIKRNLFFVIGSVVALVLLGGAGWYLYSKYDLDNQKFESLNKSYEELKRLNAQNPHPGSGPVDNIAFAREETGRLRSFIDKIRGSFQKIPSIPDMPKVRDNDLAFAFSRTISTLRTEATNSGVALPPDYAFSFLAQLNKPSFPAGSAQPLSVQLGEVKAICDVLFEAKINALDSLRRERVSPDDATGSATDYTPEKSSTNELAVITPYELTFRCFSPELASVLGNFASSPYGFIVKTVNVEPEAGSSGLDPSGNPINPNMPPVITPRAESRYGESRYGATRFGTPPPVPNPATVAPRGGLPTVLDEKKLRVSVALNIVKLLSPTAAAPPARAPGARPARPQASGEKATVPLTAAK